MAPAPAVSRTKAPRRPPFPERKWGAGSVGVGGGLAAHLVEAGAGAVEPGLAAVGQRLPALPQGQGLLEAGATELHLYHAGLASDARLDLLEAALDQVEAADSTRTRTAPSPLAKEPSHD